MLKTIVLADRTKNNDSILWENFKQGIENAFDEIYIKYFPVLLNYGLKYQYDKEFIKDCIQELFEELWRKRKKLGTTNTIRYYLLLSLKRKILKKLKYQKQTIGLEDLIEQYTFDTEFTIENNIIHKEFDQEKRDRLQLALHQLSSRQKEVIYLRFYNQFNIDEVSTIMELKKQSVRNLLFDSIKKLRKHLVTGLFLICVGYNFVINIGV